MNKFMVEALRQFAPTPEAIEVYESLMLRLGVCGWYNLTPLDDSVPKTHVFS